MQEVAHYHFHWVGTALSYYAFLKFGQRAHLEQLRNEGLVYMKSLRSFAELEFDAVRGDAFEGLDTIIQKEHVEITIKSAFGEIVVPPGEGGQVRLGRNRTMACNVYCMFAIANPVDGELVEESNRRLGDSCVVVLNPSKFLNRVASAAGHAGFSCEAGPVEYYNSELYSGDVGPFRKRSTFAHQKEFRFVVRPGSAQPVELRAGSLWDITSEVLPMSEINQWLDFSTKSFQQAF
jgi:hypothetical protein